jgi:hypothetical protein
MPETTMKPAENVKPAMTDAVWAVYEKAKACRGYFRVLAALVAKCGESNNAAAILAIVDAVDAALKAEGTTGDGLFLCVRCGRRVTEEELREHNGLHGCPTGAKGEPGPVGKFITDIAFDTGGCGDYGNALKYGDDSWITVDPDTDPVIFHGPPVAVTLPPEPLYFDGRGHYCPEGKPEQEGKSKAPKCADCGKPMETFAPDDWCLVENGKSVFLCGQCKERRARIARPKTTVAIGDVIEDRTGERHWEREKKKP